MQSIGFKRTTLEYEARPRFAGESKYSIRSLLKFSIITILCFSDLPLKLGIYSGVLVALFGLAVMIYTIYTWAKYGAPSGYATIVVLLSFMFAMLFIIVGIIGGVYRDPVRGIKGPSGLYRTGYGKHFRRERNGSGINSPWAPGLEKGYKILKFL